MSIKHWFNHETVHTMPEFKTLTFEKTLSKQKNGVVMGFTVSSIIVNLFMSHIVSRIWLRNVDDTFVLIKKTLL